MTASFVNQAENLDSRAGGITQRGKLASPLPCDHMPWPAQWPPMKCTRCGNANEDRRGDGLCMPCATRKRLRGGHCIWRGASRGRLALPSTQQKPGPQVARAEDVPKAATRILAHRGSDPEAEETAAEALAQAAHAAFEADPPRIAVRDPAVPDTVGSTFRLWMQHLADMRAKRPDQDIEEFVVELNPYNNNFVNYVVAGLIARPCWAQLPPIVALLREVGHRYPTWLPALGRAIVSMSEAASKAEIMGSFSVEGLPLEHMLTFYKSKLYESYLWAREDQRVNHVVTSNMATQEKLRIIEEMLEASTRAEHVKELEFGKALLSLAGAARIKWLMGDPERCDGVERWGGDLALTNLKPFCQPTREVAGCGPGHLPRGGPWPSARRVSSTAYSPPPPRQRWPIGSPCTSAFLRLTTPTAPSPGS